MTLEVKEWERQCRGTLGLSLLPVSCSGLFYSHYQAQVFGKTHALLLSKSMSENPQYVLLQLLEAIPQVLNCIIYMPVSEHRLPLAPPAVPYARFLSSTRQGTQYLSAQTTRGDCSLYISVT